MNYSKFIKTDTSKLNVNIEPIYTDRGEKQFVFLFNNTDSKNILSNDITKHNNNNLNMASYIYVSSLSIIGLYIVYKTINPFLK